MLTSVRPASVLRLRGASCLLAIALGLMAAGSVLANDARSRLARMQAAAQDRNYQGTMVYSSAGSVSSSRVSHFTVGDQSYERIESLDGRMQQVLRHNDQVHTLWPQSGVMVVERREPAAARLPLVQTVDARLLDQYELRLEGRQRVAGREAEVFLLQPRDELRYAQRLWADMDSGLMLRAEVIGPGKVVLESSGFSSIDIDVKAQPELVLQPLRKLSQYRVLKAQQERTQLEAEGWSVARAFPGFRVSSAVRRPLEAVAEGDGKPPEKMLQVVFSDGLTHVSLFVERFDDKRHRKDVQALIGATSTLMQRRCDFWLTAMGDVPPATLKLLLDALERRP
jgi:sigma-E factor negative regulatory protein RseB